MNMYSINFVGFELEILLFVVQWYFVKIYEVDVVGFVQVCCLMMEVIMVVLVFCNCVYLFEGFGKVYVGYLWWWLDEGQCLVVVQYVVEVGWGGDIVLVGWVVQIG